MIFLNVNMVCVIFISVFVCFFVSFFLVMMKCIFVGEIFLWLFVRDFCCFVGLFVPKKQEMQVNKYI